MGARVPSRNGVAASSSGVLSGTAGVRAATSQSRVGAGRLPLSAWILAFKGDSDQDPGGVLRGRAARRATRWQGRCGVSGTISLGGSADIVPELDEGRDDVGAKRGTDPDSAQTHADLFVHHGGGGGDLLGSKTPSLLRQLVFFALPR